MIYSFAGYGLLLAIARGKVRDFAGVFLAGALLGWLIEGVVVQTFFDKLPWQISWTGLGWHALISVGVGWYLLRRALGEGSLKRLVGLCLAFGVFWGLWAVFWWSETGEVTPAGIFWGYALLTTCLLAAGFLLVNTAKGNSFKPGRLEIACYLALVTAYFLLGTVKIVHWKALLLTPLAGGVGLALWYGSKHRQGPSLMDELPLSFRPLRYLCLLLAPGAAASLYLAL